MAGDAAEPFIRIDQMEKSVELLYDKNDTANDEYLQPLSDYHGSPGNLHNGQEFKGGLYHGSGFEAVNQSFEYERQNSEQMGPLAGTGMNLQGRTASLEKHPFADAEGRGSRTGDGASPGSKKATRDPNAESVNDIGLIAGSPKDREGGGQQENQKIHAGRETEIR